MRISRRACDLAMLILLTVASLGLQGYHFGDSNHSVQIPFLRHILDPQLYRGDLILESFAGYTTFFFHLAAQLVRATGDIEGVYFGLFAVFHLVSLAGMFVLGRALGGSRGAAALACVLYLSQLRSLGGEFTFHPRLTHTHVAQALLIWALVLAVRRRHLAALALAGAVANLHLLLAVHATVVLVALAAVDVLRQPAVSRARMLRQLAQGLLLALLLALPSVLAQAGSGAGPAPQQEGAWLALMRERSALHTFPLSVAPPVFGSYAAILALAFVCARLTARRRTQALLLAAFGAVAALSLAALVFSEFWPSPVLIRAQLLRSTGWLTLLLLPALGAGLWRLQRQAGLARAAAISGLSGLVFAQPWLVATAVLAALATLPTRPGLIVPSTLALVAAAWTGALSVPRSVPLNAVIAPLRNLLAEPELVTCAGLMLLVVAARRRPSAQQSRLALAVVAVALLVLLPHMYAQVQAREASEAWREVQVWSRDHTPRGAVLLTPPYREGFRAFSERAIAGEWKDGTQQFFSARFGFAWQERMRALRAPGPGYEGFTDEQLLELGRRLGADYAVARADRASRLPRLYGNQDWAVFALVR